MSSDAQASSLSGWLRRYGALAGLTLLFGVTVIAYRGVILPFALGLLLAYILAPVVGRIASVEIGGRPLPRGLAVLLVYVGLGATLAAFLTILLPRLSGDFARLFREAPTFLSRVRKEFVPRADAWLEKTFPQAEVKEEAEPHLERKISVEEVGPGRYDISFDQLELEVQPTGHGRYLIGPRSGADQQRPRLADLIGRAATATESEIKDLLIVGQRFLASVFKTFVWFMLTFMVAAYLLVDLDRVVRFVRSLVPAGQRSTFDAVLKEMDRALAGVIRGQLIICVLNGALTTLGLLIFHIKYALLLGTVAGALSFIPVFGSILSSVPIVTVALAAGGEELQLKNALAILGWIIGIHLLEANVLNPKIIGSAAKIHPVVVVFALLVGEESGGLMGAVLAVPIVSMLQGVFHFFHARAELESTS